MLSKYDPKKLMWVVILSVLLLVAFDRGQWADVSQWREDQATNLWLGYTRSPISLQVGLISSVNVPNPNGMPLAAVLLSRLPGLWWVSLVLGLMQGGLVIVLGWLVFGANNRIFLLVLPALSSVILRATSVEFWNNWIFTSVNLLFLCLLALYWKWPSAWLLPVLALPMLVAPSLYLAGLNNAIVYFLLAGAVVMVRRPGGSRRAWVGAGVVCVIVIGLAFRGTWVPYLRAVQGTALPGTGALSEAGFQERLWNAGQALLETPLWLVHFWSNPSENTFFQSSRQILPETANQLLTLVRGLGQVQALFSMVLFGMVLMVGIIRRRSFRELFLPGQMESGQIILLGMALVILSFVISPILGGPVLARGERIDQSVQFLPFFLFFWFGLPFVLRLPREAQAVARGITVLSAAGFVVLNVLLGAQVIRAHLDYRGSFLSEADVPLVQKMDVVGFIARDWKAVSSATEVAVSYDLGGGKWDFVPELGVGLEMYYPAPMTMGRALDYQLLRIYGLSNRQEGVQARSLYPTRYFVSYAFMPKPLQEGLLVKHYVFGRLRVSVVQ